MGHKKPKFDPAEADEDVVPSGSGKKRPKKENPRKDWDEIEEEWGDWSDIDYDD